MYRMGFGNRGGAGFEPPIELRFVDLFMILLSAFIFIAAVLSIYGSFAGHGERIEAPHVITDTIPNAIAVHSYAVVLAAQGGSGGYRWTVSGKLPEGLQLADNGKIEGVPTVVG